jgi:Tfp pilus assembly protein FimT
MKSILLVLACTIFSVELYAQTSTEEAKAIVNLFGIQKKEAVAKLVHVNGKDSAAFWKLFDEYQKIIAPTAVNRIQLYEKTAMSYGDMSSRLADSLAHVYFGNRIAQEKTLQEYYGKIKSATNAITAFEFYQAEVYILNQIRTQIMQQIPTYSQFKMATGKQ